MHSRLAACVDLIAGSRHIFNLLLLGLLALSWTGCGGNSTPAHTLLSIAVQPGNGEATTPTGTLPFTVTGTFDQPPTTQDNLNAQWSSSDTTVATVDPNNGSCNMRERWRPSSHHRFFGCEAGNCTAYFFGFGAPGIW
jgi:hypothetical protein